MKKIVLFMMALVGVQTLLADDYPYLVFETADGTKTAVSSTTLTITIKDGKLMAGSKEFTLTDLSKMYFSETGETTAVETVDVETLDDATEIYDLQGRKVTKAQMRRGVYVIKTKKGTRKVNVK